MTIKIKVLREIMQHLLNEPGEFKCHRFCSINVIDVLDCATHRQWLRQNGFTEVIEGKTYRTDKPLKLLSELLGQASPNAVNAARSLSKDLVKKVEVNGTTQIKAVEIIAPPQPPQEESICVTPKASKPVRSDKQRRAARFVSVKCAEYIKSLEFRSATLAEISNMIKKEFGVDCPITEIQKAIQRVVSISVTRSRSESFCRYTHIPKR